MNFGAEIKYNFEDVFFVSGEQAIFLCIDRGVYFFGYYLTSPLCGLCENKLT